ncbi:MAG: AMP-binding protein [Pseudomonadota bacterium]|nr:AMP-binding protein [Pseudomonadota bacterium]
MAVAPVEKSRSHPDATVHTLLQVVTDLVRESRAAGAAVTLDSVLDRDLGLDSLGRTELVARIGRALEVNLPDNALLAETPRDLLRLVLAASSGPRAAGAAELRYPSLGEAEAAPDRAATLVEVLDWHVRAHPGRTHIWLYGDADQPEALSYADLRQGARTVAAGLLERGLRPGQPVAIMLPTGRGYFFSFFGILLAGGVPVPIYPPVRPSQIEEHLRRHGRILANAQAAILITVPAAKAVARLLQTQVATLRHIVAAEELAQTAVGDWIAPAMQAQDIAFLQYTSGSTGDPKGVVLSHANLLANIRAIGRRIKAGPQDVFVSWLPLYHDMGLIGAWLGSLYYACPLAVLSPLAFLARPSRWLRAIHRHHATLSAAPNFAYELCLRNIKDEELEGLDLSSWRLAFNGAEPVSPDTLEAFNRRFARWGLRPETLFPVYGLAESSVGLTIPVPGRVAPVDRLRRDLFMSTGRAEPADDHDPNPLCVPGCGQPLPGHQVRVVDAAGRELPERQEGRLEFRGPSSTSGYFRNPDATRRLFHGDWLDSGDRAYIAGGEVYPTGRVKDLIIRGGRNIYPYELEEAVGALDGIRKGCVAAFASRDPRTGSERLVVVAETREKDPPALARLRQRVREATLALLDLPPDEVVLAPPHTVLKTSSGKIRRSAIRELYERNALGQGARAVWLQLLRLGAACTLPAARRLLHHGGEALYAAWFWTLFAIAAPIAWTLAAVLPGWRRRWQAVQAVCRLFLRLTGLPLRVQGLENLPPGPCVVVANHASYLDSLFLAATLPSRFAYVAKRELVNNPPARIFLKRLGTLFVERFDLHRSTRDAQRVIQALRGGCSLVFFPEGTFSRMPGLLPFRMGAFLAAAQAGAPVVPVTLRGGRYILRSESWFPRHGAVQISVDAPLHPAGEDWAAAAKLRDAARAALLRHCGEPDLGREDVPR